MRNVFRITPGIEVLCGALFRIILLYAEVPQPLLAGRSRESRSRSTYSTHCACATLQTQGGRQLRPRRALHLVLRFLNAQAALAGGGETAWRTVFLPGRLAVYISWSAERSISSTESGGVSHATTPTLKATRQPRRR